VRHDEQRPVVTVEGQLELLDRRQIEVVGRQSVPLASRCRSPVAAALGCRLRARRRRRWLALRAGPEYGQMTDICLEAILGAQGSDQGSDSRRVELGDRAATAANEVDVLRI